MNASDLRTSALQLKPNLKSYDAEILKVKTRLRVRATKWTALLWSLHEKQTRKNFEKQPVDPRRHNVRRRRSKMNIYHQNCQHYGARDEGHYEQQVFADERRCQRRGWVDIGDQQQEDVERVENGDAQRYLLARFRRQIEDHHRHRADGDARQDEVDGVE